MNSNQSLNFFLKDECATQNLGQRLAFVFKQYLKNNNKSLLVSLDGNLGSGKTSLVRACLQALGVQGAIKSPTYTLLEPYDVESDEEQKRLKIAHLDLYRLLEPEELDYIGARNLNIDYDLVFVEWPEKGAGFLPNPEIKIQLNHKDKGREVNLESQSDSLNSLLNYIKNN